MHIAPARPLNTARFVFLDPRAPAFLRDWEDAAVGCAAVLRSAAGRDPYDRATSASTSTASRLPPPGGGRRSLNFERMDLAADDGLTIFIYTADPGSRSEEAMKLLGSRTGELTAP